MRQRGDLEDDEFEEAVQTLRTAPVLVPATLLQLVPAASRLAADLGHPIYDCFYLALAIQEKAPLITADQRFSGTPPGATRTLRRQHDAPRGFPVSTAGCSPRRVRRGPKPLVNVLPSAAR